MKTLYAFLICLTVLAFTGSVQAQDLKWIQITYGYGSGPVSPEYQYHYNLTLSSDNRTGSISYQKGMSEDLKNLVTREFKITKSAKNRIDKAIKNSGVFSTDFTEMPPDMRMIGGPVKTLTISYGPQSANLDQPIRVKEIPANLSDSDRAKLQELFDAIENALPKSVERKVEKDLGVQIK